MALSYVAMESIVTAKRRQGEEGVGCNKSTPVSLAIALAFAAQVTSDAVVPKIISGSDGAAVRTMISHLLFFILLPAAVIANNKSMKEFVTKHAKLTFRGGVVTPEVSNA